MSITAEKMIMGLRLLSIEVFAHVELDWEVTLGGNGTNCCEAANVMHAINDMFPVTKPSQGEIDLYVKELETEIDW